MIKKRFYFDVGDPDEGRIGLVRGFFYAMAHPVATCPRCDYEGEDYRIAWTCSTLENTSRCGMSAYTDPDNIEGKEAFIEFEVHPGSGEEELQKVFDLCNKLISLDN